MGTVPTDRAPQGGEPTAALLTHRVLLTLIDHGRWDDAATYCPVIEDPAPGLQAKLLLAAGRISEAGAVLAAETGAAEAPVTFLRSAHAVMTHDQTGLPQLVAAAAAPEIATDPLAIMVMMRAARAAGRPQVAAHYATRLLTVTPGDVEASSVVVVDLVATGAYVDAVQVVDQADVWHCEDEPRPLDRALDALESSGEGPKAAALAVIGDYLHREADPTVPIPDAERASRHRWRTARRQRTPRVQVGWFVYVAVVAVVGVVGHVVTHNALPAVACVVLLGGWFARRPLPGVDPASSQLVRAIRNPSELLTSRQYHVGDVITFMMTFFAAAALTSNLTIRYSWSVPVGLVVGLVVAIAATRGRRRWERRQRTQLLRPALDPAVCCCLNLDRLHRQTAQHYVETHLFPVQAVDDLPGWQLLQCLETYRYFLACPAAGLTVAVSTL